MQRYKKVLKIVIQKSKECAFSNTDIATLVIPATVKSVGDKTFYSSGINTLTFEGDTKLGDNVFYGSYITTLTLPGSVTEVSKSFFENVNVENIVFPASVTAIPDDTFSRLWSLKSITVSKDCEVSDNAFVKADRVEIVRY